MSTRNSFTFSYCPPGAFLDRFDLRTVSDLLADAPQERKTRAQLLTDTTLASLLSEASGIVESFCTKGDRYTLTDLKMIAGDMNEAGAATISPPGNTANMLYGIVGGICMFLLWERRPERLAEMKMPMRCEMAWSHCEALGKGQQIFGVLEVAQAENSPATLITPGQVEFRNLSSNQARRLFGSRADLHVPGGP